LQISLLEQVKQTGKMASTTVLLVIVGGYDSRRWTEANRQYETRKIEFNLSHHTNMKAKTKMRTMMNTVKAKTKMRTMMNTVKAKKNPVPKEHPGFFAGS
jgi:hypothetical protein